MFMKKFCILSLITTMTIISLFACKKKEVMEDQLPDIQQYAVIEQDKNNKSAEPEKTNTDELTDDEMNMLMDDSNSGKMEINVIEEEPDYNEMEFEKQENVIFECNYIENASQESNSVTLLQTKVKGSISGLSGSFDLIVPYSLDWKRGDKAVVNYEIAYADEFKSYIRDLEFVAKVTNEWKEREAKRIAEEESIAESIRLEEEEQARIEEEERQKEEEKQRKAAEAAAKKRAQEEAARKAEEERIAAEQAAVAAAQKAIEESIAAEKANQSPVIYSK